MLLQHVLPGLSTPTEDFTLRPYQDTCVKAVLRAYFYSNRNRGLIKMPTGGGKTRTALSLLDNLRKIDPQTTGLLIAPSIDLVHQNYKEARRFFPFEEVGLVQAENRLYRHPIVVATTDTLKDPQTRKRLLAAQDGKKFSFIWIDESHVKILGVLKDILADLEEPYALRLGTSATPWRDDGRALSPIFPHGFFYEIEIAELVNQDWLLPFQTHAVQTNKKQRFQSALDAWRTIIGEERTIVFAASIKDAEHFHAFFRRNGVPSAVITKKTSRERRREIYRAFREGKIRILVNWGILTTGIDFPEAYAAIIGRYAWMKTKEKIASVHRQAVGRIIRLHNEQKKVGTIVYLCTPGADQVPELEG